MYSTPSRALSSSLPSEPPRPPPNLTAAMSSCLPRCSSHPTTTAQPLSLKHRSCYHPKLHPSPSIATTLNLCLPRYPPGPSTQPPRARPPLFAETHRDPASTSNFISSSFFLDPSSNPPVTPAPPSHTRTSLAPPDHHQCFLLFPCSPPAVTATPFLLLRPIPDDEHTPITVDVQPPTTVRKPLPLLHVA